MKNLLNPLAACLCALALSVGSPSHAQNDKIVSSDGKGLVVVDAMMCAHAGDNGSCARAVTFSIALGQVSCLTVFDQIEDKSFIFHNWYRQDTLATKKRLIIRPPRWSTVSTVELREADKGPWRVEVNDASGRLLAILRFSVVD